jgi:DNA-binding NarL/FixJ family response regulator
MIEVVYIHNKWTHRITAWQDGKQMKERQTSPSDDPMGAGNQAISVLIVDDQPIVRYGVSHLIKQAAGMDVIAATCSCDTAWSVMRKTPPRVLLIDIDLKEGCTYQLLARLDRSGLGTRILVYTANSGELQVTEALRSGAHGFVTKDVTPDELLRAIHTVSEAGSYLDPAITAKVIGQLGRKHERRSANGRHLTQRESAVLQGVAMGKRNSDIAAELFISVRTVKYHLSSMYRKLHVSNRTEAVRHALRYGLIK